VSSELVSTPASGRTRARPVTRKTGVRVDGYRAADRLGGVTVLEQATTSVPLEDVLEREVGSLARLRVPALASLLADERPEPPGPLVITQSDPKVTYLHDDGTERTVRGMIVGSPEAVVEFLLDRFLPKGEGPLAALVTTAQKLARPEGEREIMAALFERHDDPVYQPSFAARGSRRPPRRLAQYALVRDRATFEEELPVTLARPGGKLHAPSLVGPPACGVFAIASVDVRGHAVPRLVYLLPVRGAGGTVLALHDGRGFRWLRSRRDVPADLAMLLEAEGVVARPNFAAELDLLPQAHLEVRCLVRVPPPRVLEEALAAEPRRPRARVFRDPALVLDGRSPVPLSGRESVIDDPAAAAFVLSRTLKGIYVPGEPTPRSFAARVLPDEPAYLVLAVPGGLP
jgi:hypothetical protein